MDKLKVIMAKQVTREEKELKDILRFNIKKYRKRRNWSQFTLATQINISTNFLADIEAGNTWVSAQTLVKLAQAFEIEAFELLKPENYDVDFEKQREFSPDKVILSKYAGTEVKLDGEEYTILRQSDVLAKLV